MFRAVLLFSLISVSSAIALGQVAKPVAENFETVDMAGSTVNLESLRGKVVVLAFWSTRCVICHGEIPKLNRMALSYRNKDVVFLAVSMENPKKIAAYLKDRPFEFNIIPNGFDVLLKYAKKDTDGTITMPYPTFFVVNQRGDVELKTEGVGKTSLMGGLIDSLLESSRKASMR